MRIEADHVVIREFPSHLESIEEVDHFIGLLRKKFDIKEEILFDMRLVLTEAVNNAMIHGNYLNNEKTVILSCVRFDNRIIFTIKDEGRGFNLGECMQDPTCAEKIEQPNGRGLFLIHRIADRVTFLEKGRVVEIEFHL